VSTWDLQQLPGNTLWGVSLGLHVGLAIYMLWEYRWPFGTRAWRQGWGLLLVVVAISALEHARVLAPSLIEIFTPSALAVIEWSGVIVKLSCLALGVWRLATSARDKGDSCSVP
jgi:hypothetical protein